MQTSVITSCLTHMNYGNQLMCSAAKNLDDANNELNVTLKTSKSQIVQTYTWKYI